MKATTEPRYKVYKVFRVSQRRQILARNLSREDVQKLVQSFPDSSRSMVCFTRMN